MIWIGRRDGLIVNIVNIQEAGHYPFRLPSPHTSQINMKLHLQVYSLINPQNLHLPFVIH